MNNDVIKDALVNQELAKSAAAAVSEPATAPVEKVLTGKLGPTGDDPTGKAQKEAVYANIEKFLIGKENKAGFGREVFDYVIAQVFEALNSNKYIRFNDGNGALSVKDIAEKTRKIPNGQLRTSPATHRVKYIIGAAVQRLVDGVIVYADPGTAVVAAPEASASAPEVLAAAALLEGGQATEVAETLDLD